MTFVVLVLSNLALIQANRSWGRSAGSGNPESSRQFAWIAMGTIMQLGTLVADPEISRLFSFAQPSLLLLLAALSASTLAWLWFECVKWGLHQRLWRVG
jgi:Ca2+-transporting ATPase